MALNIMHCVNSWSTNEISLMVLLCFLSLFLIRSRVSFDGLINRDSLGYQHNSSEPFTGTSVEYHGNGQLQERTACRLGKWDGISEGFYQPGQLEYKSNYKNGALDGSSTGFYENGNIKYKGNFRRGDGSEESFYKSGQLQDRTSYKAGKENGPSLIYRTVGTSCTGNWI